jgi:hypothetical protein
VAELLDRAQLLIAAGPYDARPAEIAAVHAAIYPERDAVCQTCRGELGRAYYAIQRWANQQNSFSTSISSTVKKSTVTARFKSDNTIYTPHGLGVAYSNTNLTDKAARYILENDPDAKELFSELPGEASEEEQELTPAQQVAEKALTLAENPKQETPAGFDYAKLASAMVDELERRSDERTAKFEQDMKVDEDQNEQLPLTASTGGTADGQESDNTDSSDSNTDTSDSTSNNSDADTEEKPVRLARMNKEQLVATYTTELGQAPAEGLTNDELRDAIAQKRASQQDPE